MMKKRVWKTIIVAWFVGVSGYVFAEPIAVLGVTIEMPMEEIKKELGGRGFDCEEEGDEIQTIECRKPGSENSRITFEETEDGGSTEQIEIMCGAIGICEYTLDEAAEMFVASVNVETLSRKTEEHRLMGDTYYWTMYCGRGDDGDKVCIRGNIMGDEVLDIIIYRENFGKGKPSFN